MKTKFTKNEIEMLKDTFSGAIYYDLNEYWVEKNKEELEKILGKLNQALDELYKSKSKKLPKKRV